MIQFGSTTVTTKHVNYEDVRKITVYTERHSVKDHKDVLSEFLKLHKRYKDEGLHEIGFKLIEKDGKPQFVDLIWS